MMAVTQQSNYASLQQSTPSASPYNFMNSAGVYVHSNPPRPLISSSTSTNSTQNTAIRNWIKGGDLDKLENIVLEGQGARLLGLMDSTNDVKVKSFLRGIPGYMAKVDLIHDAVIRGSVRELQTLLDKKKLSLARDAVGRGLAHKAVLHSQRNVLDWLGKKYPDSIQIRDNESRTCLHYSGISKNPTDMYNFLLNLGSNPEIIDIHGRKASYYLTNPQELYIEGVGGSGSGGAGGGGGGFHQQGSFRGNKSIKRGGGGSQFRRRISPISPKSSPSPPTTTSNNLIGQPMQNLSAGSTLQGKSFLSLLGPTSPQLTRAQIRIWIHEKDISKLEQIVWSGNGDRLLLETTNNPKVRRFLDNVPYLLHHIKLIHTAAIHNDVEGLKEIRSRIERSRGSGSSTDGTVSISPELFTARDSYGLSAMHKASGLNNRAAVEYLMYEFPGTINLQDNFKRTPLHYAAVRVANEPQNTESIYKFLQRTGADTSILDYKQQDAPYYLTRPAECDSFKFLRNIPDAPRVLSSDSLLGWDRSGVPGFAAVTGFIAGGGVGLALGRGQGNTPGSSNSQKRKISDEFVDSLGPRGGGGAGENKNKGAGNMEEETKEEKPGSGGKIARTEENLQEDQHEDDFLDEEDDEIRDVGDGYVADSDEGKYDIQAEDVIIGEEDVLVEEDEEPEPEPTKEDLQKNQSPSPPRSPQKKQSLKEPEPQPETENGDNMNGTEAEEEQQQKEEENVIEKEEESRPRSNTMEELQQEIDEDNKMEEEQREDNDARMDVPEDNVLSGPVVPEGEDEADGYVAEEEETASSPAPPPPRPPSLAEIQKKKSVSINEDEPVPPPPDYTEVAENREGQQRFGQEDEEPEDSKVEYYLATSDMESLVNLVLRGKGNELVDRTSSNPEIQEFLQNVPAYMAKIATIHKASFTGNIRDLQSLLDRKRLAEAQDSQGRAALHHAILGGHNQIVRYLINGYPGCLEVKDKEGRTALHYAAVIGDEGVLYRVLIQAGSDPNLRDKLGNTPGVYLRRKDLLKVEDLIKGDSRKGSRKATADRARPDTPYPPPGVDDGFTSQPPSPAKSPTKDEPEENDDNGNGELNEEETLRSSKFTGLEKEVEHDVVLENANNNFPAIWSEEGKYLASVLGDALVKGLSLVSQERPSDPVEFLANFLRNYKEGEDGNGEHLSGVDAGLLTTAAAAALSAQEAIEARKGSVSKERTEPQIEDKENNEEKMEEDEEKEGNEDKALSSPVQAPSSPIKTGGNKSKEEEIIDADAPPATENSLNDELTEGYDKLEDTLDEEESASSPFDPEKEELAEKALIESTRNFAEHDDGAEGINGQLPLQSSTRDENGQSVLHFACTRPGGGSTIMAFLHNPSVNLAWRDVNLRTARDIAENLQRAENIRVVDNWVLQLAAQGQKETLEQLLIDGYEHLADLEDSSGTHIVELAENAEQREVALLLRGAPEFKEKVERVHRCVRSGDIEGVKSLVGEDKRVAFALNPKTGRTAMHVAVLCEEVAIVKWLSEYVPQSVKRGDNLERTCLHYAMGVDKVEKIVRILVRAGAKRVVKDLRDRQPSWYFINRDEIGELQTEERAIVN